MDWVTQDYINIELDSNRNQLIRVRPITLVCRSGKPCTGRLSTCIECRIRTGFCCCLCKGRDVDALQRMVG